MYYYLISFLILIIVVGVILNIRNKEHYVNHYSGKNQCGENDSGPMDKPKIQPSCFYYNINKQNEQVYNILDQTAIKLDNQIARSLNIDNRLINIANENNEKINNLMKGPIVIGIRDNLDSAAKILANIVANNKIDNDINMIYSFNESDIEKTVLLAIQLYIDNVLNKILKDSNINLNQSVANSINENMKNKIIIPIYNIFLKKFNQNSNKDIVGILKTIIGTMDIKENVKILLDNAINSDKQLKSYINASNKYEIRLGDFVYFRHKLEKTEPALCADNNDQLDIIVGGSVCSINNVNKTVRISYNFVMNPNKNTRCNGLPNIPNGTVDYDNAPEGLPKWYPHSVRGECGIDVPRNLSCKPSQWSSSSDEWVKTWIGGINRVANKMDCGVSPTGYKLPVDVPISILSKDLNKLILNCDNKSLFTISNPKIPLLSISNFPSLGSIPNWVMSVDFNVSGGQNMWRPIIGDMYNNVNLRGWGVWVSSSNSIHFSWKSNTWNATPAFNVLLNRKYNLTITKTPSSITLLLTDLETNTKQTSTNNSINGYVMSTNGPVTIGGWINDNGEKFIGTISNITVK